MQEKETIFDNHQLKIEIEGDVLHAHYKAGMKLTLSDAKFLVDERVRLCEGKSYHFMIYDGGVVSMDRDARVYFSSEEGIRGILSAAFIESSVFSKMLINFFLKITNPKVRSKAFTNLEDAMLWIKGL